jgi:hypothetical protein
MATIVAHPALRSSARRRTGQRRTALARIALAVSAPLLATLLTIGMVDALAVTQHDLMGLYDATVPVGA